MSNAKKVTTSSGNVFADLGFANPEEELLKAKLHNQSPVSGAGFGPDGVLYGKSLLGRQRPAHRQEPPAPSFALKSRGPG